MAEQPDIRTRPAAGLPPADRARYDDTLHCNRCGFCTSFCPTYLASGDEALSPRGRNQALRALFEGRLRDPSAAARSIDTCLQCGICTSVCFAEVPTGKLMAAARGKLPGGALQRFVFRALLPRPRLLAFAVRLGSLARATGLPRLLNRLGLLRRVSPALAAAEEIACGAPLAWSRPDPAPAGPDAEVVQFRACGSRHLMPAVEQATAALLERSGRRHGCAAAACCGLPASSQGDADSARALARQNIAALERHPEAVVLVDDSSCAAQLKEYPSLFGDDAVWRARAQAVAGRTKDLAEWLRENPAALPSAVPAARVTYHDPCKARYAQKITEPPRALLKALSGADYVELPEADQCCGGGGTTAVQHPELSGAVLERKARNIVSTGADVVLTSSVSCLLQLRLGLRRLGSRIAALHVSQFLGK